MKTKQWILIVLLMLPNTFIVADENFAVSIELKDDTLDVSNDSNLSNYPGDPFNHFAAKAIIKNVGTVPKILTYYEPCTGFNFEIKSKSISDLPLNCLHNMSTDVLLEPNETYNIPIRLPFRKDYAGDTLRFSLRYIAYKDRKKSKGLYWSDPVTIKLIRDKKQSKAKENLSITLSKKMNSLFIPLLDIYPMDIILKKKEKGYWFGVTVSLTNVSDKARVIQLGEYGSNDFFRVLGEDIKITRDVRGSIELIKHTLQPQETYSTVLTLWFPKSYSKDTLKFKVRFIDMLEKGNYSTSPRYWSKYFTINLRREIPDITDREVPQRIKDMVKFAKHMSKDNIKMLIRSSLKDKMREY